QASICPPVSAIFPSQPDASEMVTYLATGWHSGLLPIYDLAQLSFYEVYADATGVVCVYDTHYSGDNNNSYTINSATSPGYDTSQLSYIEMRPNNNYSIDTSFLRNNVKWTCIQKELQTFPPGTQWVCTCNESLEACNFAS